MRGVLALLCVGLIATVAGAQTFDMTDTLPGTFVDISATGTNLNLGDDQGVLIANTVGNDLIPAGGVYVWSNGNMGLYSGYVTLSNSIIPTTSLHSGMAALAPFWDDLNPSNHGAVYWEEIGDTLVVQWDEVPHYGHYTDYFTFQVQLFGSGSVRAQYIYPDAYVGNGSYDYGAGATVGWQLDASDGQTWSHNQAVILDGTVLSIIPEPASLALLALGALALRRR